MPKNPVRAARQAGRQQVRAAKQTSKVAKIQGRTQKKLEKLKGTSATTTTSTASAPKFKTAEELKSTIKMPDFKARAVEMAKDKAKASGTGSTGYKAPVTKSTTKSTTSKTATTKKGPQLTPQGKAAVAKADAERYRKDREQGTYVTKPENRNQQQKDKVVKDNARGVVSDLKAIQDRALAQAKANPKSEGKYAESDRAAKAALNARRAKLGLPPMKAGGMVKKYNTGGGTTTNPYTTKATATAPTYKRSGVTLKKNPDGTYSKAKMGGMVKRKK